MSGKKNQYAFYTGNGLYQQIESLKGEIAGLNEEKMRLENLVKAYTRADRDAVLNDLLKENLQYRAQLQAKEEKIEELVSDVIDQEVEIEELTRQLHLISDTRNELEKLLCRNVKNKRKN